MFIDCYKWDKTNGVPLHRKLSGDHIFPTNQQRIRHHLAEDVFDNDMLHVMSRYQQTLGANASVLDGVIDLLKQTSKLIDILKDMRPIKSMDDQRLHELLEIAKWFHEWQECSLDATALSFTM